MLLFTGKHPNFGLPIKKASGWRGQVTAHLVVHRACLSSLQAQREDGLEGYFLWRRHAAFLTALILSFYSLAQSPLKWGQPWTLHDMSKTPGLVDHRKLWGSTMDEALLHLAGIASTEGLLEEPSWLKGKKTKNKIKHPVTSRVFSLFIQAGTLPLAQHPHIQQLADNIQSRVSSSPPISSHQSTNLYVL